jgi:RecB family exonuclease
MLTSRYFSSSAQLQDFLLQEAGPNTLVVVPHQRLARQLWHRQRLQELGRGQAAWEPLSVVTLQGWWAELFRSLWAPVALAPSLVRLALWRQALAAAPALAGVIPDLTWARALDEAYGLLSRHLLPTVEPAPLDSPLVAWRRQVSRLYAGLLEEGDWLAPADLPGYLLSPLKSGKLPLPGRVLAVGLETPAPVEEAFLEAVAGRTRLLQLQVKGDLKNVQAAVALPDRAQELAWVAAHVLTAHQREGIPLHRLAVTALNLEEYTPRLERMLAELLGAAAGDRGYAYNFSLGPALADTPLFQGALLPVSFLVHGERRQDLVSLLLSPYYQVFRPHQGPLARGDRLFREERRERSWPGFREALRRADWPEPGPGDLLARLDQALGLLGGPPAGARDWLDRLRQTWSLLGFPGPLDPEEAIQKRELLALGQELETALAPAVLSLPEFLEWLLEGARQRRLPGPGREHAGLQVLGLLEIRGLDFDRVFCLGLNAGTFPPPPRALPLLAPGEKARVLGGTYESQQRFALELRGNLLGVAPHLVCTRPRTVDEEERAATPLLDLDWGEAELSPLSRPHPAWLRAPAVRAALAPPPPASPAVAEPLLPLPLPAELSISQAAIALACPCRFLLEVLLNLKELPEVELGLSARERGDLLHRLLARFTREFRQVLQAGGWDQHQARQALRRAAHEVLQAHRGDLHWQAELERWLGEGPEIPGLLWEWLRQERDRYEQGWQWREIEIPFKGLGRAGWPFTLRGRLDRLDYRPAGADLVVWDYKSGQVPSRQKVFEYQEEHQLPAYLLAVKSGLVPTPPGAAPPRAGFIGLKSVRAEHLKHQDYGASPEDWDRLAAAWEDRLVQAIARLRAGDYQPAPSPTPGERPGGACQYCPYPLVCGYGGAAPPEEEGEEA